MQNDDDHDLQSVLEDLIEDIEQNSCVLLIGPEALQIEGQSLARHIHQTVMKTERNNILYYYPSDSLFLFRNARDKNRVARRIKRLYKNIEPPLSRYQKILELPINLVISLNPDTHLSDVAKMMSISHYFSHFRYSGIVEDITTPTRNKPLIYNLCGCRTEEESLVLDFEDLFKLLRAVLPDGLPNKVRLKLREANSFLFLGFDFEKWYSQLLLQLLTYERKGRPKFALNANPENPDHTNFLIHQFQIQFLGNDQSFFERLHESLNKKGLLRKTARLGKYAQSDLQQIKEQIGKGKIEQAFSLVKSFTLNSEEDTEFLLLNSRFEKWRKDDQQGVLHHGQSEAVLLQITRDFLKFLKNLE